MANFLKSLFVKGVEIDTTGASTGNVLSYNGSKFAPATPGSGSLALNDLSDVVVASPEEFQGLSYNGVSWVNSHIPLVSYVRNAESTTITTGTCVYLFGATGDHATVKRADNTSDTTSSKTIGVVGADITASNNGPIVTRGYVDGIDLSTGYTAGDILWLGTNGAFTKTKPTSPAHLVFIGVVVRATNNGIIYVATQNGYELDELHNVNAGSPSAGDFLKYNGSLWVNDAIDLGTDTTGSYVASLVAGTGISLANNSGEGATPTITNTGVTSINTTLTGAVTGVVTTSDTGTVTSAMIADGTIVNADVSTSAAIAHSKLANATAGQVLLGTTTTGVVTATTLSGDVTINGAGVTAIGSNVIVNADVNASAAIALSKLASGTAGQVVVANASGVPTYTTISGDITVSSTGVATIAANSVALGTDTTGNYMSDISGTSPVSVSHTPAEGSSATVSLASGYGDTQNPYGSKTANTFLAAPNGLSGVPSFRSIVAADIPILNQNTTGNAATVTTNANLTGDVTSVGNATTIGANKVTRSMLAVTEQMPIGTILMWAGGSTTTATYTNDDVPSGFLLCDGQEVLRTGTYANLFSVIDIRYGQGDGSTTFNLPNLIAFAPVGSKQASAKTNGIRGTANAVASSFTTTGATTTTAHHSHSLTGSNSTASNIALTGSNTGGSNIYITGANSNIADNQHRHTYQKPTANYFQTDTGYTYAISGSNSNIGLAGSNAGASNIGLSGSNAAASNFSAATITSGNTTAHSHTISGHAVVYIIKY